MKRFHYFTIIITLTVSLGCSHLSSPEELISNPLQLTNDGIEQQNSTELFYYYFSEIIYLSNRDDLVFLKFQTNESRESFISEITSISSVQIWDPDKSGTIIAPNYYNALVIQAINGVFPATYLDQIKSRSEIVWATHLTEYHGILSAVTNEFSVKLKSPSDYPTLEALVTEYSCELYHREWFENDVYSVRVPKDSKLGTIQLANFFHETGQFVFTAPVFFVFDSFYSSDPKYSSQWGLKNTGQTGIAGIDINIEQAWNITEGSSNVTVAVLDSGVELNHPDLSSNLVAGYDGTSQSTGGAPLVINNSSNPHGTKVAGIIGAIKDNNEGISGVAPNCKIMPINGYGYNGFEYSAFIAGINWAQNNGVDIFNCSWGGGPPDACLTSAINNATSQGRGGKGCVFVFASGKNGATSVPYPGYLDNVIAVGSIGPYGYRSIFSDYGSSLDVVAPGESIWTTTLQGSYDNPSGTSFAAPHVSGIAALILSEYPDLTASQVRRAIELGCTFISGYSFQEDDEYPSALWNNEVGYGRANAYNALLWADFMHETNVTDGISGFDFTLTNHSSYDVYALFVGLTGDILNSNETLIFHDPGIVESGMQTGYPFYRGENLSATPGTTVSNMWLELFATTPNYYGNLRIGVAIDNTTPTSYTNVSFGDGDTVMLNLPNSTVPSASRRRVYIDVRDPL